MGNDEIISVQELQRELNQRDKDEYELLLKRLVPLERRLYDKGLINRRRVISNQEWAALEDAAGRDVLRLVFDS